MAGNNPTTVFVSVIDDDNGADGDDDEIDDKDELDVGLTLGATGAKVKLE